MRVVYSAEDTLKATLDDLVENGTTKWTDVSNSDCRNIIQLYAFAYEDEWQDLYHDSLSEREAKFFASSLVGTDEDRLKNIRAMHLQRSTQVFHTVASTMQELLDDTVARRQLWSETP